MIVSLGVFSVVVTVALGALLILIASNRQLQEEQNILSNLAFAVDSMTRELRTGSQYYCDSASSNSNGIFSNQSNLAGDLDHVLAVSDTQDCPTGNPGVQFHGIAFIEGGQSLTNTNQGRILYFFDGNENTIFRRVGNGTAQRIVSEGIYVVSADFFVTGSGPLLGGGTNDSEQASVTIVIEAADADPATGAKTHWLQTTVVQRTLDI